MGEEHGDLVEEVDLALIGLFPRGLHADDDVPQRTPRKLGELAFLERECEHVGRTIFTAIDFVQLMDAFVVR